MSRGRLETIGYTEPDARAQIDAFVRPPYRYLVDIRYKPYCGWNPEWNRDALKARYGRRYMALRGLGNVNAGKPGAPIELFDPEPWIAHLTEFLQRGRSFLLLCACKHYERCHRRLVYSLIMQALDPAWEPETVTVCTEPVPTYAAVSLWE